MIDLRFARLLILDLPMIALYTVCYLTAIFFLLVSVCPMTELIVNKQRDTNQTQYSSAL